MDGTGSAQASVTRYFLVDRREISYLKFILEAYEGMSTLSTHDNKAGIVRLVVPVAFTDDMTALMTALSRETGLVELTLPEDTSHARNL